MELSKTDLQWAENIWAKLQVKMEEEAKRMGNKIPYIAINGVYEENLAKTNPSWWTNGFWPGMLWQMYHVTGNKLYMNTARQAGEVINNTMTSFTELVHDIGFMWLHSAVADFRLTGKPEARATGLHAANLLAGRYNSRGNYIRAWNGDLTGWMIIDCMMNLPLLYWASKELGDPRFDFVAMGHADTTLKVGIRPDGSCNHIVSLDPVTGEVLETPPGQGYASGSSWSRGQAWAIYGMTLSYKYTGEQKYLDAAKQVAHYFVCNVMDTEYIPLVDFRAPKEPVAFDTTAGVCAACGMIEIAGIVGEYEKDLYQNAAIRILKAIETRFANWDPSYDSIIGNGTGSYHGRNGDYQVPIIYGDYFFIEAILKLLGKDFKIW